MCKGDLASPYSLDGEAVSLITAFLFHAGSDDDPARLAVNSDKAFIGSYVLGMGFTFDDADTQGVASPLSEMRRLITSDPCYQEVTFPYIGGEEVNSSPTHAYHRYVINFGERDEEECRRRWPDLLSIVESKERVNRSRRGSIVNPERWWMFARPATDLYTAIGCLKRVLAISRVSQAGAFVFLQTGMVYSEQLVIFAFDTWNAAAVLQSRVHDTWARFFSSSMKDDLRYTPSDCFETFPFPNAWESLEPLEAAGGEYYNFRSALMIRNGEGLTATYNRFHDPNERDSESFALRELHAAIDRSVLDAYGWTDIPIACEFLLDYDPDEEGSGSRKKPWRCRWPDGVRDEVLARLLALNAERAEAERLQLGDRGIKTDRNRADLSSGALRLQEE